MTCSHELTAVKIVEENGKLQEEIIGGKLGFSYQMLPLYSNNENDSCGVVVEIYQEFKRTLLIHYTYYGDQWSLTTFRNAIICKWMVLKMIRL